MGKKVKTAYELALERLGMTNAAKSDALTKQQKEELAEIDRVYRAKAAEQKILAENEIAGLVQRGKFEEVEKVKEKLTVTLGKLEEQKKEKKEEVRSRKSGDSSSVAADSE